MNKIKEENVVFFGSDGSLRAVKGVCLAKNFRASFQALRDGLMGGD